MRWIVVLALTLLSSLLFAQGPVVFDTYQSGQHGNIDKEQNQVLLTEGAFQTYWKALTGESNAPREIKWNNEFLIAINLGQRPTNGYKVFVESIERVRGNLQVNIVEIAPGGVAGTVMTSPWTIIRVNRTPGNITFNKIKRTSGSGGGGQVDVSYRWRTFMSDVTGGGPRSREQVINNAVEFREYWKALFEGDCPHQEIDWSREMLIAIHLGNQSTNGYNVLVETVSPYRDGIGVSYVKQVPASGQKVSRGRTSPYILIRVPRAGRVYFDSRTWASEG